MFCSAPTLQQPGMKNRRKTEEAILSLHSDSETSDAEDLGFVDQARVVGVSWNPAWKKAPLMI